MTMFHICSIQSIQRCKGRQQCTVGKMPTFWLMKKSAHILAPIWSSKKNIFSLLGCELKKLDFVMSKKLAIFPTVRVQHCCSLFPSSLWICECCFVSVRQWSMSGNGFEGFYYSFLTLNAAAAWEKIGCSFVKEWHLLHGSRMQSSWRQQRGKVCSRLRHLLHL